MLIGDRGTGVGSRIKGHLRYGGKWKQILHGRHTQVCIVNENNTSQTCVYCFHKLHHAVQKRTIKGKEVKQINRGSFRCINQQCAARNKAIMSRDTLSALAIALSGTAQLLFQQTFPAFSTNTSQSNTEFHKITSSFLNERERQGSDEVTIRNPEHS